MGGHSFIKMHGLGNDFVVLDGRTTPVRLTALQARRVADRHEGVGCDQVITIEPPRNGSARAFMRIQNADGGEVEACGNGARCVAHLLMAEEGGARVVIETLAGLLAAERLDRGRVAIDMGEARLDWRDIPLASAADTNHVSLSLGALADPVAVNIGNPHAVFFVRDAAAVPLEELGPRIEHHELFPERANVSVVEVRSNIRLRARVWERGVGITRACGSAACAVVVAAHRRGLAGRRATVELDGGALEVEWLPDNHVRLAGPVTTSFTGALDASLLG